MHKGAFGLMENLNQNQNVPPNAFSTFGNCSTPLADYRIYHMKKKKNKLSPQKRSA